MSDDQVLNLPHHFRVVDARVGLKIFVSLDVRRNALLDVIETLKPDIRPKIIGAKLRHRCQTF
jgi:hypothetical protein